MGSKRNQDNQFQRKYRNMLQFNESKYSSLKKVYNSFFVKNELQ